MKRRACPPYVRAYEPSTGYSLFQIDAAPGSMLTALGAQLNASAYTSIAADIGLGSELVRLDPHNMAELWGFNPAAASVPQLVRDIWPSGSESSPQALFAVQSCGNSTAPMPASTCPRHQSLRIRQILSFLSLWLINHHTFKTHASLHRQRPRQHP